LSEEVGHDGATESELILITTINNLLELPCSKLTEVGVLKDFLCDKDLFLQGLHLLRHLTLNSIPGVDFLLELLILLLQLLSLGRNLDNEFLLLRKEHKLYIFQFLGATFGQLRNRMQMVGDDLVLAREYIFKLLNSILVHVIDPQ